MKLTAVSEDALMLHLGDAVSPALAARVQGAVATIETCLGDALVDLVPSYGSVLIIYKPEHGSRIDIARQLRRALAAAENRAGAAGTTVTLPVYYGPETGPDLASLAAGAGLDIDAVITLHSGCEYRVYAIGFAPGFAYLGQVDERIAAPRLASPRARVPAGSVAIADRQTAVYPAASPGGWNLIGRCPVPMFDPSANPCMPVSVGDTVRFEAVDRARFLALGGSLE